MQNVRAPVTLTFKAGQTPALALLVCLLSVYFAASTLQQPVWTPDGFVYAQMMLADRGVPKAEARAQALAFYLSSTPVGKSARYRPYFVNERLGMFTQTAKPFASRVLYPFLASAFYPWLGFRALLLISALAYVAAALILYWLLLAFCRPFAAAAGALVFAGAPVVRVQSGAALTDMLALALLAAALAATIRYAIDGRASFLALALVSEILLSLSRPLPYVPLMAAFGLALWALRFRDAVRMRRALLLILAAVIASLAYALSAAVTKTPSLGTHLHWLYDAGKNNWLYESRALTAAERGSFRVWYNNQLLWAAKNAVSALIHAAYPAIALVLCALGLYSARSAPLSAILAGFIAGCALGIFANPVPLELPRLIAAPAMLGVAAGIAMLLDRAAAHNVPAAS